MIRPFLLFSLLFVSTLFYAQEMAYGFKAGLNFNSFISDSETDDTGNELEDFTGNTGFHVGATFTWKATELMGVRGEFLFSQKGGRRSFDGPSYLVFTSINENVIATTGNRDMSLNVTHSYIDLPVMGYFKPVSWLEIYGGGYASILVSSSALGEMTYSGKTSVGANVNEFNYSLDYSYFSDDAGEASFLETPPTLKIGNEIINLPDMAGAYYEFSEDRGKLYKPIDLGLVGGVSLWFSRGLYGTFRVAYGMRDITKEKADVSLVKLDADQQFISRNDKDKNLSLQASIGFSF